MECEILESITPEFHLVKKLNQNSYKKSFDLIKKKEVHQEI